MVEAAVYATRTYGGVRGVKPYSIGRPTGHPWAHGQIMPCRALVAAAGLQPPDRPCCP